MSIDVSMFEDLQKEAQQQVDDASKSTATFGYLDLGIYRLRIYPEVKNGRLRYRRDIWVHRISGVGNFICQGDNCPLCAQAKRLRDAKKKNAFKFESQLLSIMPVYIASYSEKSEYIKVETPTHVIAGRWAIQDALNRFIAETRPADLRDIFDVTNDFNFIRLDISESDDGKWKVSVGLDTFKGSAPALPEDFPKTDEIYLKDDDFATPEQIAKVAKIVSEELAKGVDFRDPGEATHQKAEKPSSKSADILGGSGSSRTPSAKSESHDSSEAPPWESSDKSTNQCPSKDPDLGFAKHPKGTHPDCDACKMEASCWKATKSAVVR